MHLCAAILVLVVAFMHSGSALSCYECNPQNPECADPFTEISQLQPILCPETLSGGQQSGAQANANAGSGYGDHGHGSQGAPKGKSNALCYKAVVKSHNEHYEVFRGCGWKNEKETCDNFKNSANLPEGSSVYSCKTCTGEHCNSAPRHLSVTLSLLLVAPLTSLLINKF